MQISIDQMTTVINTMPFKVLQERILQKPNLYFQIVLQMSGKEIDEENHARFKKYIVGYVQATNGNVQAIAVVQNQLHLLVGLQQTRSLFNFVSELKLVSKAFARRKLNEKKFNWREEFEAFTVSLSEIDYVKRQIKKQMRNEKRENFVLPSWQSIASSKVF